MDETFCIFMPQLFFVYETAAWTNRCEYFTPGCINRGSKFVFFIVGPNFVPQSHLSQNIAQGTPNSEDIGSGSPAGSSPYADIGTPSPKSDDHARMGTKQKAKSRSDGSNQCTQCGKSFSSSSALAKHKLIHSDERRYVCTLCSKGFKRQDHL